MKRPRLITLNRTRASKLFHNTLANSVTEPSFRKFRGLILFLFLGNTVAARSPRLSTNIRYCDCVIPIHDHDVRSFIFISMSVLQFM